MERVQRVIEQIEPHDSVERYTGLGVDVAQGTARIVSPWEVEITRHDGRVRALTTRSIVIAAGARPFVPPIPGIEQVEVLTSDNVWELRQRPERLVVLGGGPIGCELTQAFARLGCAGDAGRDGAAHPAARGPRGVRRWSPRASAPRASTCCVDHKAERVEVVDGEKQLVATHQGQEVRIPFDALLVAVGRVANLKGYGLEELGVDHRPHGRGQRLPADQLPQHLRRRRRRRALPVHAHRRAPGLVCGGQRAVRPVQEVPRRLPRHPLGHLRRARGGARRPERARGQGDRASRTRSRVYGIDDLDRAIADGEAHGFVKVLTVPGKDRILGVTIVGEHAGDLLAEYVLAMKHGIGLNKILGTIHTYPTLAEANKYAAGDWKRAHAPQALLAWVERFHAWRRG